MIVHGAILTERGSRQIGEIPRKAKVFNADRVANPTAFTLLKPIPDTRWVYLQIRGLLVHNGITVGNYGHWLAIHRATEISTLRGWVAAHRITQGTELPFIDCQTVAPYTRGKVTSGSPVNTGGSTAYVHAIQTCKSPSKIYRLTGSCIQHGLLLKTKGLDV